MSALALDPGFCCNTPLAPFQTFCAWGTWHCTWNHCISITDMLL